MGCVHFGAGLEVGLEWREEVSDDWNTPCLPQQALAATATKVADISVVLWEPKQPARPGGGGGGGGGREGQV